MIDFESFSPWSALGGGVLIGLSAGLLYGVSGRIAGISGIMASFLADQKSELGWRCTFLLGLMAAPLLWALIAQDGLDLPSWEYETPLQWVRLIVAGLLVGFGTRMANGCTSGHGVCGLARFSRRSLVAVLAFMASGMATVYMVRHLVGG